jgi:Tfp pilus assembly protein PilF
LEIEPEDVESVVMLGHYHFGRGNLDEATWQWEKAFQLAPDDRGLISQLALVYSMRYDEATTQSRLESWLEEMPDSVALMEELALRAVRAKNIEAAREWWERILSLEPEKADVLKNLGVYYLRHKHLEKEIRIWERVLGLEPQNKQAVALLAAAHTELGLQCMKDQEYQKATDCFGRAISIDPGNRQHWYNRACAYARLRDRENTLLDLSKALLLDPGLGAIAQSDPDFEIYFNDPSFLALVMNTLEH